MASTFETTTLPLPKIAEPITRPDISVKKSQTTSEAVLNAVQKDTLGKAIVNTINDNTSQNRNTLIKEVGDTLFGPETTRNNNTDIFKNPSAALQHTKPTWVDKPNTTDSTFNKVVSYSVGTVAKVFQNVAGDGHLRLADAYHQDIQAQAGIIDINHLVGLSRPGEDKGTASGEQIAEAWKQLGKNELKQLTEFGISYGKDLLKSFANNLTLGLLSGKKKSGHKYDAPDTLTIPTPSTSTEDVPVDNAAFEYTTFEGQPTRNLLSFGAGFEFAQRIAIGPFKASHKDITAAFFETITTNTKYLQPYQFLLVEKRCRTGRGAWTSQDYRVESFDIPSVTGSSKDTTYGALNTNIKSAWNTIKYYCNIHVSADARLQNFLTFCKRAGLGVQQSMTTAENGSQFSLNLELPNQKKYVLKPIDTSSHVDFNIGTIGEDMEPVIQSKYVLKIISDRDIRNEAWVQYLDENTMDLSKGKEGHQYIPFNDTYTKEYKNKEVYIGFDNFKIINVEPDKFEIKSNTENSNPRFGFTITASWTSMYIAEPWTEEDTTNYAQFNSFDIDKALFTYTPIKPIQPSSNSQSSSGSQ